jgi:hypothetical protein
MNIKADSVFTDHPSFRNNKKENKSIQQNKSKPRPSFKTLPPFPDHQTGGW